MDQTRVSNHRLWEITFAFWFHDRGANMLGDGRERIGVAAESAVKAIELFEKGWGDVHVVSVKDLGYELGPVQSVENLFCPDRWGHNEKAEVIRNAVARLLLPYFPSSSIDYYIWNLAKDWGGTKEDLIDYVKRNPPK